jgi:peptidoglycan/xylan/chitin deacetylase (PgdA/CDA1 family)
MGLLTTTKSWGRRFLAGARGLHGRNPPRAPLAVILGYHSIQYRPELCANTIGLGITHAASAFARQMELIACECSPVSLGDILHFLMGELPPPRNAVAVTFDDGYLDNAEIAAPVLARYGIPAAFFLTTSLISTTQVPWFCRMRHAFARTRNKEWVEPVRGQQWKLTGHRRRKAALQAAFEICSSMTESERQELLQSIERDLDVAPPALEAGLMMTWDQARALRDAGHLIGSHTCTHPNLAHVANGETARAELFESKRQIEKELNAAPRHFSYPHPALNPQWTPQTVTLTQEAGYETAVTTTPGVVFPAENTLLLPRLMAPARVEDLRVELQRAFRGG